MQHILFLFEQDRFLQLYWFSYLIISSKIHVCSGIKKGFPLVFRLHLSTTQPPEPQHILVFVMGRVGKMFCDLYVLSTENGVIGSDLSVHTKIKKRPGGKMPETKSAWGHNTPWSCAWRNAYSLILHKESCNTQKKVSQQKLTSDCYVFVLCFPMCAALTANAEKHKCVKSQKRCVLMWAEVGWVDLSPKKEACLVLTS